MRLTVCLEGNGEGRVLTSLDMEDIVKMTQTNDVTKCNLTTEALADHDKKIRDEVVDEFVDALTCQACFTNMQKDAIRIYAEQMKGEQNE